MTRKMINIFLKPLRVYEVKTYLIKGIADKNKTKMAPLFPLISVPVATIKTVMKNADFFLVKSITPENNVTRV